MSRVPMPPEITPPPPPPPLRLKLDEEALTDNWRALAMLSGKARAGAAVKADGYGLGARRVVKALAGAGCADFFVAHWSEAAEIADLVSPASISVLHGPMNVAEAAYGRALGVRAVINTPAQARHWLEAGGGPCDVMVDTGINRIGLTMEALSDPAVRQLQVQVLLSHLASADDESSPLNDVQRQRWEEARRIVAAPRASLANSAGITLGAAYHGELTRPGLALYGGVPCAALAQHIRQVARPQAMLLQVRQIAAGDNIGYNATFTASRAMRVGVISLGYADGYLRSWSGKGMMRSGGADLPVLGRVSMDMTVIDLSAALALEEGDWVDVDYDLPRAAADSGLSQYELLTLLGLRFTR
ncbi:MAG: alanine racemase [Novosphingobium sp.]